MATEKTSAPELDEEDRDESEDEESEEEERDEDEERDSDEDEDEDRESDAGRESGAAAKKAQAVVVTPAEPGGFMSSMRNVWTIGKRELRAYFDSLVAYVVIGLSMLGLGTYFFGFTLSGGFWQIDRATMARMFDFAPGALCLVIPLVTMGTLAEERRSGTIELLITMPVKDSEVILGKYIAALGLCTILLLATLTYPVAMFVWPWHLGPLDWGPVWTGYLGLFLYCGAGVAIGMMFSSFTESQIISFFVTALVMLGLWSLGLLVETFPGWAGDTFSFISFQSRFQPFARGLIDSRAVVYFVSVAVICLLVSFRALESRKWK
ncbi:MAG TPA: ABC transporter permease [Polyangiaceae bacterium]|nr:ABC transporter permease [Polyangiaceae bacterium]